MRRDPLATDEEAGWLSLIKDTGSIMTAVYRDEKALASVLDPSENLHRRWVWFGVEQYHLTPAGEEALRKWEDFKP